MTPEQARAEATYFVGEARWYLGEALRIGSMHMYELAHRYISAALQLTAALAK